MKGIMESNEKMENTEVISKEQTLPTEMESGASVAVSDEKKTESKGKKYRKTAVYVLVTCLLLLVAAFGAATGVFYHYYSLMAVGDKHEDYSHVVSLTDEEKGQIPEGTVNLPEKDIYSQKDVTNILLIGTDERTEKFDPYARADSIMVLSLNKKTNAVKLVSLERGMLVKIPNQRDDILTHTFHYGGAKLVMETVRTHFNLDVDRYVRVNFAVFEKLVDEVGGVDVTLTRAEAAEISGDCKLKEGVNHLDGSTALKYARLRQIDSDWERVKRQRKIINSIKNNMKGQSVGELNTIANQCLPYVQTNLSSVEFADLLIRMPDYVNGEFYQMTIPKKGTFKGLGNVDFKANSKILRDFIYNQ